MNTASGFLNGQMPARQRGAVLAVALIFMVVLTLLGVAGMSTTVLEERMAGNLQAQTRAFQAAETGVARIIRADEFDTSDSCTGGPGADTSANVGTWATVKACRHLLQEDPLPASRRPEACGQSTCEEYHFSITGKGETQSLARTTVVQGIGHLSPNETDAGTFTQTGETL